MDRPPGQMRLSNICQWLRACGNLYPRSALTPWETPQNYKGRVTAHLRQQEKNDRLRAELCQDGLDAEARAASIEQQENLARGERHAAWCEEHQATWRQEHQEHVRSWHAAKNLRAENAELQKSLGAASVAAVSSAEALARFRTEQAATAEDLERFRTESMATTEELTQLRAEQGVMVSTFEELTRLRAEQEVMARELDSITREHERLRAEYATVQQVRMIETHQLTEAIRYMRFLSYLTPHLCNLLDHCIQLFFSRCDLTALISP